LSNEIIWLRNLELSEYKTLVPKWGGSLCSSSNDTPYQAKPNLSSTCTATKEDLIADERRLCSVFRLVASLWGPLAQQEMTKVTVYLDMHCAVSRRPCSLIHYVVSAQKSCCTNSQDIKPAYSSANDDVPFALGCLDGGEPPM